jgi:hypothetical protein
MRLTIADEALTPLEPHVTPSRSMEQLVEQAVGRIGHVGPQARYVVLDEEALHLLETRLGCTSLSTAASVVKAVDVLADVKVENISLQFTPSQLQELKDRALREEQSVGEYVRRIVYALIPQFFLTAPAQVPPLIGAKGKR